MALKTFTKTKYLGSVNAGGTAVTGTLKLTVTENSTDISNNRSNCTAKLQLIIEPSGYSWRASSGSYSLSGDVSASGNIASMVYYSGTTILATKDFQKGHSDDGTGSISVGFSFSSSNVYGGSETLTGTLTNIPRKATILSAEDFTDEGNPTITYENKAGSSVSSLQIGIYSIDESVAYASYRDVQTDETSYTFELTNTERDALRSAIPNDNELQVKYILKTVIGSNTYYSELQKKMTLINANPTFSNFVYEDTNSTTLALTGNNQYCVLGHSNIKATISASNKAIANKGASMSKYRLSIGASSTDIEYSSSADVNGTINNASNGAYLMYAIDSRNNATSVTKLASVVKEYQNIYINKQTTKIERNNNGTGTSVQLTLKGTFWNDSFGSVTNTIKSISYKYKKTTSSNWVDGTTSITTTASGNNFSFVGYIAGDGESGEWDTSDSYNVRVTITDELSTDTIDLILNSGTPTLALAKSGVAIMGMYDTSMGSALQIAKKRFEDYLYAAGITWITDCNDMLKDGAYGWSDTTLNTPIANTWGTILVINDWQIEANNFNTTVQLGFIAHSNNEKVFFRERYGSSGWNSWKQLSGPLPQMTVSLNDNDSAVTYSVSSDYGESDVLGFNYKRIGVNDTGNFEISNGKCYIRDSRIKAVKISAQLLISRGPSNSYLSFYMMKNNDTFQAVARQDYDADWEPVTLSIQPMIFDNIQSGDNFYFKLGSSKASTNIQTSYSTKACYYTIEVVDWW